MKYFMLIKNAFIEETLAAVSILIAAVMILFLGYIFWGFVR